MLEQSKITNVKLSIQISFSVEIKSQSSNDSVPLLDANTNFEAAPKFIGIKIKPIFLTVINSSKGFPYKFKGNWHPYLSIYEIHLMTYMIWQ